MSQATILSDSELLNTIQGLKGTSLYATLKCTFVDSELALSEMIDALVGLPVKPPSIYVDLEGIHLSRQGSISILQLYIYPRDHTYLVDVHQLREKAFSTTGTLYGRSLRDILEAKDIPKVFFDVRNDSDALFSHYQINLLGVCDLQLMELATRNYPKQFVTGLQKCMERDAPMTATEKATWRATKERGFELFNPDKGGRYEVFNERPLAEEIIDYCVQDVQFLPRLWSIYDRKMTTHWEINVRKATEDRVSLSQSACYDGHGRHMALAPQGWYKAGASRIGQGRTQRYSNFDDDY